MLTPSCYGFWLFFPPGRYVSSGPGRILLVLSLPPYRSRERKGMEWERAEARVPALGAGRWALCPRALSRSRTVAAFSLTAQLRAFIKHSVTCLFLWDRQVRWSSQKKSLLTSCASAAVSQNLPVSAPEVILIMFPALPLPVVLEAPGIGYAFYPRGVPGISRGAWRMECSTNAG